MVDTQMLKGYLTLNGYTLGTLANKMGLSRASISYKVNNGRLFTPDEMIFIYNELHLSKDEFFQIFFSIK